MQKLVDLVLPFCPARCPRLSTAQVALNAHERLASEFREFRGKTEEQVQFLNKNKLFKAENAFLKGEQNEILERLARIESYLGFPYVDGDEHGVGSGTSQLPSSAPDAAATTSPDQGEHRNPEIKGA